MQPFNGIKHDVACGGVNVTTATTESPLHGVEDAGLVSVTLEVLDVDVKRIRAEVVARDRQHRVQYGATGSVNDEDVGVVAALQVLELVGDVGELHVDTCGALQRLCVVGQDDGQTDAEDVTCAHQQHVQCTCACTYNVMHATTSCNVLVHDAVNTMHECINFGKEHRSSCAKN